MLADFTPRDQRPMDLFIRDFTCALAAHGRRVRIFFANPAPPSYVAHLESGGVDVGRIPSPFHTRSALALRQALHGCGPWVLQTHFIGAFEPRLLALKLSGAVRGLQIVDHLSGGLRDRGTAWRALQVARGRVVGKVVDEFIAVSNFVAARLRSSGAPASKIQVIENGIPISWSDATRVQRRTGPLRIAFAGQLIPQKGASILLRAVQRLNIPAEVLVAGLGPARAALEGEAIALGVKANFLGQVEDVRALFRDADVVAIPSIWDEAFGFVAVEAMAAGAPVVVSDAGALPEIVGDAGLVVKRGDPRSLTDALGRLQKSESDRRELGAKGQKRVRERFSMERMVRSYVEATESLLARADATRAPRRLVP